MTAASLLDSRMNIRTIVWPIFVEHLIRMSLMTVDIFMLARYSEDAVAAVGLTGNFIFFLILTYMIVSSGSAILMGQYLGSKQNDQAQLISQNGLFLSAVVGVLVGILFYFVSPSIVSLYDLAPQVHEYAIQYLIVVGTFSIGLSLSVMLSTILRAHGFSKSPMLIQMGSGLINAIGNYIALFPPGDIPVTGVTGVAAATVVSQMLSAIACWVVLRSHNIPFSLRATLTPDKKSVRSILKLGIPNGGEGLSYNFAQMVIMFFVAQIGTAALATMAIGMSLARFMFVFAMAVGQGAQIIASYFVGQNRQDELKARVHKYWVSGSTVAFSMALITFVFKEPIIEFFSTDIETKIALAMFLTVSLLLEPGRAINLIVIAALKGTGDVVFPVKMGILCMWGIGVVSAYFFGIHLGWGILGIMFGIAMDEWIRGIIMIFRWQSGKWMRFKLASKKDVLIE
jgi:putative MATE family efflux protein